jgi:hypothetical protein
MKNDVHSNQSYLVGNHLSAVVHHAQTTKTMRKMVAAGRCLEFGIRQCPPAWPIFCHPSGSTEKKLANGSPDPDNRRTTSDLSAPCTGMAHHGVIQAVNDSIHLDRDFPRMRLHGYVAFTHRLFWLETSGLRAVFAMWDEADCYLAYTTLVKMHASRCRFWASDRGPIIQMCLVMIFGDRAAANIAQRGSVFVCWLADLFFSMVVVNDPALRRWFDLQLWAQERGRAGDARFVGFTANCAICFVGPFLDDFNLLCFEILQSESLSGFSCVLVVLKIIPQVKKVFPDGAFSRSGIMLGFHIDLNTPQTASIPKPKIDKAVSQLDNALAEARVPFKLLESLVGLLEWMGQLLDSGCSHLCFSITALTGCKRKHSQWCTPNADLQQEWQWWRSLLTKWNGVRIIIPPSFPDDESALLDAPHSDANRELSSLSGGGGAHFRCFYFATEWLPEEIRELDIYELEAFALVLWLHWLCHNCPPNADDRARGHNNPVAGRTFTFRCDNESFVHAVRRGRSSIPTINWLLLQLHELQAIFSFSLRVDHVPGVLNVAADALSRGLWTTFFSHMEHVYGLSRSDLTQVDIPQRHSWSSELLRRKRSQRDLL